MITEAFGNTWEYEIYGRASTSSVSFSHVPFVPMSKAEVQEEGTVLPTDSVGDPNSYWRVASLMGTLGSPGGPAPLSASAMLYTRVEDKGLIRNMDPGDIYGKYLKLIGAGAVAAGGIIGMCRALPARLSGATLGREK